jgi:hypothetical protein
MDKRRRAVLVMVVCLVIAASAGIAWDTLNWQSRRSEKVRIFQQATGGLGMGAIASPIWQFIDYDARIHSIDDSITWPVPGGYSFGPDRTATVTYFHEKPESQWVFH